MKKIIPTLFFILSLGLHAQVGIGNTNPQATLDVEASNTTSPANNDGILIPRMSNFPTSPAAAQDGMLIFYTGSGASGKGFYYWDNSTTTWIYLSSGSKNTLDQAYDEGGAGIGRSIIADSGAVNIQGNDGLRVEGNILAALDIIHDGDNDTFIRFNPDRIQMNAGNWNYINIQNANQEIAFNEDGRTIDFRVESDTNQNMLFVDGTNSRVGIGTNSPGNPLHIGLRTTFDTNIGNTGQDGIFIRGGNTTGLNEVGGSISFGGAHPARDNSRRAAIASMQTGIDEDNVGLAFYVHQGPVNTDPMVEAMRITHQRYLGINNTSPSATLDVVGTMQFVDGNEATGYVLSSDASGNASWTNPSTLFTDTNTTYDGTDFALSNQSVSTGQYVIGIDASGALISATDQDNQNLTSATLSGTTLNLAIENGTGTSVDLAALQDGIGTDDQNLSLSGTLLSIEDGNNVNLSTLQDGTGTDDQNLTSATLTGTTLNLAIENGTGTSVNLATLQDGTGTDDQNLSLSGTVLSIEDGNNVNLSTLQDGTGTDDQNLTSATLTGTTLNLAIENGTGTSVNLATLQDGTGTDDQNLSLSGTILSIEDGNNVNLSTLQDGTGTDDQNLTSATLTGTTLNLAIENGTGTSVNLAALQDGTGTDDQNIQNLSFNNSTNILTVGIENGTAQTVDLSVLNTGGDITQITAGSGMTGGGTTGAITLNAYGTNGLLTYADDIRLGGTLTQNTQIALAAQTFDINLNSTGDFAIQDAGTDVFFVENTGDIGIGNSNPSYPLHITESVNGTTRGVFIDKTDNSGSETSGLYVEKTGNGSGRNHAIFTDVDGTGDGQKYGVFNRITSSAIGNQYGTRNFLSGATSSFQFGTFNNLANNGTGNQYGVYNGMRGESANNLYAVYNEFDEAFSGINEITGVKNQFSNGNPGTSDGMNGIFSRFTTSANGNYYGVRNEFTSAATGTGNKYGSYNIIDSSAGGNQYGVYSEVTNTSGYSGYYIGRFSVSTPSDSKFVVASNGDTVLGGDLYWRDEDTSGTILAQMLDDGDDARFILRENGSISVDLDMNTQFVFNEQGLNRDFRVESDGNTNMFRVDASADQIGIGGFPDIDFHVFHGNNGSADGMKLQNTNNNNWFRMYVSSSSGDLRFFSTNQGTTAISNINDVSGVYTATSDRRLKKDFKNLYFSWDNFMNLQPLTYKYKADNEAKNYIGMVAQDVQKIYPELITYHKEEDVYHMDYSATGVIAVKAVQELKKEVDNLKTENAILREKLSKLEALETRILALENSKSSNTSKNDENNTTED